MTKVWIRSIILIFISFAFGFLIGTIPVQKSVFPAYSQWVTNQKQAADTVSLNQSSRTATPEEGQPLPEPGTLEEQQLVERFTLYPLHFLEKAIEAKRRQIESTQVRSFFTLSRYDQKTAAPTADAKKWMEKVALATGTSRVYRSRGEIHAGALRMPVTMYFTFRILDGRYCWSVSGLYELTDKKERFRTESCENLNDFGKFQDAPYALVAVSERGVRDWLTYLAVPVPALQDQPAKLLTLESETGLWKEESLIDWSATDANDRDRFENVGSSQ